MLKIEEYIKTVHRVIPTLFSSLICEGYNREEYFAALLNEPFSIKNLVYTHGDWYYSIEEIERSGRVALASWRDADLFARSRAEFDRRADALEKAAASDFKSYSTAYAEYMPALTLIYSLDKPAEEALRAALLSRTTPERANELMDKLNVPLLDNYFKKEEYELVQTTDLEAHVKEYQWLYARYGDERAYTIEEAKAKLASLDKESILKKRDSEKAELVRVIAEAKELLVDEADLVDIFQYMIYYRTHRTDTMSKSSFLAIPMLKAKAKELALTYEEFIYCSSTELIEAKLPSKEIIQARVQDFSMVLEGDSIRCLIGKESQEVIDYFTEQHDNVTHIKGSIACKGLVTGTVKVVSGTEDFNKVSAGDVLVTSMTTPIMIPIMKIAAAFVTDEGGVTCHAAIISREMGKPCIIGTKIATKVLKDGDKVEVDANKGVVTIV